MSISLAPYIAELDRITPLCWTGQVTEVVGLLVESRGPSVAIGDFCEIHAANGRRIRTQVIGFRDGRVLSMPLEEIDGLQLGDSLSARSQEARSVELRAATSLACLWVEIRERQRAYDLLAPVYGWFTEGFDTPDLKKAKAQLDEL